MSTLPYLLDKTFRDDADAATIRSLLRLLTAFLAGMHTWAAITSQSMNADGISYLDIGDAYFRGDWNLAINPVWPPLYAWILGLVNLIVKPSMTWEFPVVHLVNFAIFIGTMASFEFLWGKLRKNAQANAQGGFITLPAWAWWITGYSLFIWTSLALIQMWAVTPDMLTAALLYLAAGLLVDIRDDSRRWRPFIYLGIVLGLGYLAKTFMFSIALVFLALCLVLAPRRWASIAKVAAAAGIFFLISLPFILLISNAKGKPTIGEAGTVTYLRYVHGIPFPHWQGDPARGLTLDHPSRVIHQSPPVYAFVEPVGGTYPISTDPSYWFDGLNIPFNLSNQVARLFIGSLYYLDLFLNQQGIFLASVAALYFMGSYQKLSLLAVVKKWTLVIPAAAAFGLYVLVLVSGRYIGAFVLLLWADILANIRLADTSNNRSWLKVLSAVAAVGLLANIALFNLDGLTRLNPSIEASIGEQASARSAGPVEVAEAIQKLGIQEGDTVGVIGYGFDSFWARLARVKIVAEMLEAEAGDSWTKDAHLQQSILQAFASTGARAVIAENIPMGGTLEGWHQINDSNYFVYLFPE